MSLFIADDKFAREIKRQLIIVALPNSAAGQQPVFLPSQVTAGGRLRHWWSEADIKYTQVVYNNSASLNDLGAKLVAKLATDPVTHVFIHGADPYVQIIFKYGAPDEERHSVKGLGGGFTTDVETAPHIEVFVDGSAGNTDYPIWTTDYRGWGRGKGLPYVRLYHELVHADRMMSNLTHGEKTMVPLVNQFRKQRGLGYERAKPWFGSY